MKLTLKERTHLPKMWPKPNPLAIALYLSVLEFNTIVLMERQVIALHNEKQISSHI